MQRTSAPHHDMHAALTTCNRMQHKGSHYTHTEMRCDTTGFNRPTGHESRHDEVQHRCTSVQSQGAQAISITHYRNTLGHNEIHLQHALSRRQNEPAQTYQEQAKSLAAQRDSHGATRDPLRCNAMHVLGVFSHVISAVRESCCGTTDYTSREPKHVGRQQVSLNGEFRNSEGFRLQIENRLKCKLQTQLISLSTTQLTYSRVS